MISFSTLNIEVAYEELQAGTPRRKHRKGVWIRVGREP